MIRDFADLQGQARWEAWGWHGMPTMRPTIPGLLAIGRWEDKHLRLIAGLSLSLGAPGPCIARLEIARREALDR